MRRPQHKPRPDFTGWGSFRVLPRTIVALGHLGTVLHYDGVRDGPSPHAREPAKCCRKVDRGKGGNMSVANGFVPATFSIKCGPSSADDLPSEKRFLPDSSRTGSSSTVADELYGVGFNRAEFVQDQSISAAAPAILCPTPLRPKYFRALHLCVENISIVIANCMTDLLFLVGKKWVLVGNRWAILWLFILKYLADTSPRCSSAACVPVVRIHERCVRWTAKR
jgi:hypothetical protein